MKKTDADDVFMTFNCNLRWIHSLKNTRIVISVEVYRSFCQFACFRSQIAILR